MANDIFFISVLGTLMGIIGTGLGGIIGCFIKNTSNKVSSAFLQLSAGVMTTVVCFDLLPEGFKLADMKITLIGFIFGVLTILVIEDIIIRLQKKTAKNTGENKKLFRIGFLIFIGIMLHNLPEGLAIGAGFGVSMHMGITLAIVIALHDVPEGIAIALPLRKAATGFFKPAGLAILSGVPTGIGALIGALVGGISEATIGISLGFAGGAMLYIVSGELIPESRDMYKGRFSVLAYIVGFIAGILVTSL